MNIRRLVFSLFLVVALGFALVANAEEAKPPRGPKITNKARRKGAIELLEAN